MATIRLKLRTDRPDKITGKFTIYLLYQYQKQCETYRTKEKLYADNWDITTQRCIYLDRPTAKKLLPKFDYDLLPSKKEVEEVNNNLSDLKKKIADIEQRFELNKEDCTIETVIEELKNSLSPGLKKVADKNEVYTFIDDFIKNNSASKVKGSLSVYKALKRHLKAYEDKKGVKVLFGSIDYSFFQSFQNFLIEGRTEFVESKKKDGTGKYKDVILYNTTIAKQLSTLKTFLNYAKEQDINVSDKYKKFKIRKENLPVIALTNKEFETLVNIDLSGNKKLDQIRDVFVFSCCIGLRFSDVKQFKREHIKGNEIHITTMKTKDPLEIEKNDYLFDILEKYNHMAKPLPVISNAKTNLYLKELCKLAGINQPTMITKCRGPIREDIFKPKYELVTFHTARRTFATLSLEKGVSEYDTMWAGGWKSHASFKRYVNITKERIKLVMSKAWSKPNTNKLKAV